MDVEDVLARFCYYFPQYTYQKARRLPAVRVRKMLRSARNEHDKNMAAFLYELVQCLPVINSKEHYNAMLKKYDEIMRK